MENTTGFANTSAGVSALHENSTGDANSAFGLAALYENTTGRWNTGIGCNALGNNIGGENNTACGLSAMFYNTSGSKNTALGLSALENNQTGNYNTATGYMADVNNSAWDNATALGAFAFANASNKVVIGDNTTGIVIGGYASWSNYSDGRFKENVRENVPGLDFITKLRPVTYTINEKKLEEHITQSMPDSLKAKRLQERKAFTKASGKQQTGFIAQEVENTASE